MKKFCFALFACFAMFMLAGCGASESDICEAAKGLVSEQCARMNSDNPAVCTSVTLKKKIADNCWSAEAKLDNGTTIPMVIKLHDDGQLEIDFSAWLGKQVEKAFDEAGKELQRELENDDDDE